jgi:hypothetical protein
MSAETAKALGSPKSALRLFRKPLSKVGFLTESLNQALPATSKPSQPREQIRD